MKLTRTAAVGAAALSLIAVGGIAGAAIPSSTGVFTACSVPPAGTLRVIDAEAGQTCKKGEQTLTWNQAGQPGADGANGADGVSGYTPITKFGTIENTSNGFTNQLEVEVNCPSGLEAIGGDASGETLTGNVTLHAQNVGGIPIPSSPNNLGGWEFYFMKSDNSFWIAGVDSLRYTARIICADVTP